MHSTCTMCSTDPRVEMTSAATSSASAASVTREYIAEKRTPSLPTYVNAAQTWWLIYELGWESLKPTKGSS